MKKWICFLVCILALCGCSSSPKEQTPYKIIVTSDTHYFEKSLYENYDGFTSSQLKGDGKMVQLSDQILDLFCAYVKEENPDLVLITGDLTFNGERLSHQAVSQKLQELGCDVAVINGNHDTDNPISLKFKEGGAFEPTESVTREEFKEIYQNCGYQKAVKQEEDTLSYMLELNKDYNLILLDSCLKEPGIQTGSDIKDFEFLKECLEDTKSQNKKAIIAMHHNFAIHNSTFYEEYTIDNNQEMAEVIKDYDVPVIFSGHIHMQNIAQLGDTYDIASSSLIITPCQYGKLELTSSSLDYSTVVMEEINGEETFFDACNYQRYLQNLAPLEIDVEMKKQAAAYLALVNRYYFEGTLYSHKEQLKQDEMYQYIVDHKDAFEFFHDYLVSRIEAQTNDMTSLHIEY